MPAPAVWRSENGIELTTIGLDAASSCSRRPAERRSIARCAADALRLPFADKQHRHGDVLAGAASFRQPGRGIVLREMNRVARVRVIVSDIQAQLDRGGGIMAGARFPFVFMPLAATMASSP